MVEKCFREVLLMKIHWSRGADNKAAILVSTLRSKGWQAHSRCWKGHLPSLIVLGPLAQFFIFFSFSSQPTAKVF